MGHLTLREALASNRLDAFVQEQQDQGAELATGSELERGLALLITQRRSLVTQGLERRASESWRKPPLSATLW
jgi:hypothetical protein